MCGMGRTHYWYIIVVGQWRPFRILNRNRLIWHVLATSTPHILDGDAVAATLGRTAQQANPIFAEQPAQRSRLERASYRILRHRSIDKPIAFLL
jgi:hypothetical protein